MGTWRGRGTFDDSSLPFRESNAEGVTRRLDARPSGRVTRFYSQECREERDMRDLKNWAVELEPETKAEGELSDAEAEQISGGVIPPE